MAVYLKDFFCRQGPFQYLRILYIEIRPIVCFCRDSTHVFILSAPTHSTIFFFGDCRSFYFHSLIESTFLDSKGLLCLYDKQNNTRLLVDMKFLFS